MQLQLQAPKRPARRGVGQYLYAIIDGSADRELGPVGLEGGMVRLVSDGEMAVVISDAPPGDLRPERRRLAAHHGVLKRLAEEYTVLPVTFGMVAKGLEAVRRILAANRPVLLEHLQRLQNRVEMGLRVVWDVPNVFEYFVARHPALRQLRDQLFLNGQQPSQDDKIELGRLFDRLREEDRARDTEQVQGILGGCCIEIKANPPRQEREVMNLACLVSREQQKEFEEGVVQAARFFDNHFAFDFNGPWPPHNFVHLNLKR